MYFNMYNSRQIIKSDWIYHNPPYVHTMAVFFIVSSINKLTNYHNTTAKN